MANPYHYLFYYTWHNVNEIKPLNSREAAIIYLTVIVFFLTMPFVARGAFAMAGKDSKGLFFSVLTGYALLIYYLNKRYFEKRKVYTSVANNTSDKSSFKFSRKNCCLAVVNRIIYSLLFPFARSVMKLVRRSL